MRRLYDLLGRLSWPLELVAGALLAGAVALAYTGHLILAVAAATLLSFLYERFRDEHGWSFRDFIWRELPLLAALLLSLL